ncbi:MAG: dTDP-4-dehydrorhamnose reductase [Caldilineaceae bacterium]|nr:dTDP-4-dehydrorhamnose reductase [Caldilineaceae bacterium]
MRVLITGAQGQLGRAVAQAMRAMTDWQVIAAGRGELDITRADAAGQIAALAPDLVVNTAAWTDVDRAEQEPDAAFAANALGPLTLAEGCAACGAALVQFSTNEIFAGDPGRVYYEYDLPQPRSVYARSKAAGETAAARVLNRFYIVRVAWLFGPGGNHFPAKMIAAADRHGTLRVVADEIGNPTYAPDVAAALVALVQTGHFGIYHLVNTGQASRLELAQAALDLCGRAHVPLTPIRMEEWPRAAPPPPHAVLVNQAAARLGIVLRPWQEALREYMQVEQARFALPVV